MMVEGLWLSGTESPDEDLQAEGDVSGLKPASLSLLSWD